jgi:hypothetical protein
MLFKISKKALKSAQHMENSIQITTFSSDMDLLKRVILRIKCLSNWNLTKMTACFNTKRMRTTDLTRVFSGSKRT